jgi:hypothetical protein
MEQSMQDAIPHIHADTTSTAVIGLAAIVAIMLFATFINRISAFLLPFVRSRVYSAAIILFLALWLVDVGLDWYFPPSGFLAISAALFILRVVLELAAPRRGPYRQENPPDSPYGTYYPPDSHGHSGDGSSGGGDGGHH